MPHFTLKPEASGETLSRAPRLVSSGLVPTADVPTTKGKAQPDRYGACSGCGREVLQGKTRGGLQLALDVSWPTYCVVWDNGASWPRFEESRGYPVHQCPTRET